MKKTKRKKEKYYPLCKKVFLICLILVVFIGNVQYAEALMPQQERKIALNVKDAQLKEVLEIIKEKTEYSFFIDAKDVDLHKKVTIDMEQKTIQEILDVILKDQNTKYEVKGNHIIITSKNRTNGQSLQSSKYKKITGIVKDQQGEPIIGANVSIKETSVGTITSIDGDFALEVPEDATLQISYIGYITQNITVANAVSFLVELKEDTQAIEEVVVVGYGTQKKVNLTGSIEVVGGERLQNRPSVNASQALQGTVPGMNFSYGNSGSEPGASLSMQIRGQGEPYVLIDGTVGDINMINPNDIESISVLKDAAASAIYGARAPYGVVLITTKSGKNEERIQVEFSANVAHTKPIRKPKMVDSYTFVRAMNEMHDNQGVARLFAEETIDRIVAYINDSSLPETVPDASNPSQWSTYLLSNGNNDWIDTHFGTGLRHQENISVKGGGKSLSFYLSAGHAYEKGIVNFGRDNFNRITFNSKLDLKLTDWWSIASNTRVVETNREYPNYDDEGDYDMMIHQIIRTHPQQFLKSPNGYYSRLSRIPMIEAGSDKKTERGLLQRFSTEIKPMKNWTINADYSVDVPYISFVSNNPTAYEDLVDGSLSPIPTTVPSYMEKYKSHEMYQSLNLYSNFDLDIKNDHHFSLMLGYQQESNKYDYLWGLKRELITPEVPSISTATGEMQTKDEMTHWSTQGYFTRLNYNYKGKYLLEVNARYDGTSKFARGQRWGFFPSFSLGWNVSHENFWQPISPYINSMKIRASWGRLGNQNVEAYQDLPLLGTNANLGWILNSKRPAYTTAPNLINPFLTWESSETTDIGLDLGLLNNRLQVVFDYYQRLTFDRLGPAEALPAVLGATIPQENNSELRTRGWDLSLTWRDKVNKDFSYSVTAMIFDYSSKVTKYNNPTKILTTDYIGKKIGEIWGYETEGLIKTKEQADQINANKSQGFINGQVWQMGDVMYKDHNGDGKIDKGKNTVDDHGDWHVIGNSTPRYQFGITLAAEYKSFDLSVFFQGTGKRDLWLDGNMFWGFNQWNQSSLFTHHMDYYRDAEESTYSGLGINTNSYFPRPYSQNAQYNKNKQPQTRYLQNGAYLRLKNLQIGYALPKPLTTRIGLERLRLYVSAENIMTLTSLPNGFDPETANLGKYGNGKSIFSQAIFSFGLNVSF